MSEQHASGNGAPSFVARVKAAQRKAEESILADVRQSYPALVGFLCGIADGDERLPAGTVYVSRGPRGLDVTLRLPAYSLEARYQFSSFAELVDTLENDIGLECVPWQLDFQARRKEQLESLKRMQES